MAVVERPDMPKTLLGVPGLNPWNILFINVVFAALLNRKKISTVSQLDVKIKLLVGYYFVIIIISFLRGFVDQGGLIEFALFEGREPFSNLGLFIEDVLNPIKYVIPGFLLFYGADNKQKVQLAIYTVLLMHLVLALQIIKEMPLGYLTDGTALEQRAIRVIGIRVGYFRSDLSIVLAGSAWAIYALKFTTNKKILQVLCFLAFIVVGLAIALTGGRAGQGVFLVIGLVFGLLRWRRVFLLAPIGLFVLVLLVPSVYDRFTQGFSYNPDDSHFKESESETEGKFNSITSGRTIIWPYVIEKIAESPIIGNGRRAMKRIGLSMWLAENLGEGFPHPHNAYLQLFLDNGVVFGLPILLFYFYCLRMAIRLFLDKKDNLNLLVGAFGTASILSFLLGAIAQQSFYPPASSLGMFCAIGLVLRLSVEKAAKEKGDALQNVNADGINQTEVNVEQTIKNTRKAYY
jgi:O-antigen ligase